MRTIRESACWTAALALGAGMIVGAMPASADTTDNDGLNIGNDNNVSVAPIQLCGNNVGVLGLVAPIGSGQDVECTNAPIVDHPQVAEAPPEPPAEEPPASEPPADQPPADQPPAVQPPDQSVTEVLPEEEPPAGSSTDQPSGQTTSTEVQDSAESLPEAPAPEATEGHLAVTG